MNRNGFEEDPRCVQEGTREGIQKDCGGHSPARTHSIRDPRRRCGAQTSAEVHLRCAVDPH